MSTNEIETRRVEIKVEDGTKMGIFVATPKGAEGAPGILVFQEAFGVNSHIREVASRLAREGYVAVAPDLFHRTGTWFESRYDFEEAKPHFEAVTQTNLELDIRAAYNWIRTQGPCADRVGAIGFCMGGRCSFIANAIVPLKAAVSFYGGRIAPALLPLAETQSGPALFFWGGKDKHILPEHHRAIADALTKAGKPFINVEFSEADHGFFCNERGQFHALAAEEAWVLTRRFLKDRLGG